MFMKLKSIITTTFFLLFLLLASPCFSRGGLVMELDSDVYEIDYRGPETHSSVPPPDHSREKPMIHSESAAAPARPKGLKGRNASENEKKIHG